MRIWKPRPVQSGHLIACRRHIHPRAEGTMTDARTDPMHYAAHKLFCSRRRMAADLPRGFPPEGAAFEHRHDAVFGNEVREQPFLKPSEEFREHSSYRIGFFVPCGIVLPKFWVLFRMLPTKTKERHTRPIIGLCAPECRNGSVAERQWGGKAVSVLDTGPGREVYNLAHRPIGPSAHRPIGPSAHRPIGPSAHRPIGPSAHRPIGPSAHRPIGPSAHRPIGPSAHRPIGPSAHRPIGPSAHRPIGPSAHRPIGPSAHRPIGPSAHRPIGPSAHRPIGPSAHRPIGPSAHRPECASGD